MRDLLPAGRHFAVTWSIPDNYLGMTKAMFHRSRAFVTEAATPVDVLTFDWRSSYDSVRDALHERGVLIDGMRLRNVWEELANADADQLRDASRHDYPHFAPLADDTTATSVAPAGAHTSRRVRFARDKETVLQRDYVRGDGSMFASDRLDIHADGPKGIRCIHLCDRTGAPIREFRTATSLYQFWLDLVTNGHQSYLVVDSKYFANFLLSYRREHVVTCYVSHNSHLDARYDTPYSPLTASRRKVYPALERFDAVALLTERQRHDVRVRLGDMGNLHVIPNSHRHNNLASAGVVRDPRRGVMLVSLTKRKQVDHAIKAFADAPNDPLRNVEIHVYGEGNERKHLEELIESAGLRDSFLLEGFTNTPISEFQKASFTVLTSSAEGFPLVLLEAMATGCIPIAYDIRYGPSQIIDHGVNGYLVSPGDIECLRQCITHFLDLPEADKAAMRAAAMKSAAGFADDKIVPRWGTLFRAALDRKQQSSEPPHLQIDGASITMAGGHIAVDCDVSVSPKIGIHDDGMTRIAVAFRGRHGWDLLRSNATSITELPDGRLRVSVSFPNEAFEYLSDAILDASIDAWIGGRFISKRIKGPDMFRRYTPYSTIHGNLSLERRQATSDARTNGRTRAARALARPITTSRAMWRRMRSVSG